MAVVWNAPAELSLFHLNTSIHYLSLRLLESYPAEVTDHNETSDCLRVGMLMVGTDSCITPTVNSFVPPTPRNFR